MARELPIRNGRLTTDLDADGHRIVNLPGGGVDTVSWEDVTDKPSFATVATSGSYNDLSDKPTIPAAVTVDAALDGTSANPVRNSAVKAALDGKLSKAEAAAGFTEWVCEPATSNGSPVTIKNALDVYGTDDGWLPYVGDNPIGSAKGDSASVSLSWTGSSDALISVSATRTRLPKMSDIPTKTSDLQNDSGFLTSHQDISGKENVSNKVTSISAASTDAQYPSAKCVYDIVGDVEAALAQINGTANGGGQS